jgi:hypothetical protein
MSPNAPRRQRTQCSAKSLRHARKSCANKELQLHGVEDGHNPSQKPRVGPRKADATPSLRGGRLAGPEITEQSCRARGLPRQHEGRPVADVQTGRPVRRQSNQELARASQA